MKCSVFAVTVLLLEGLVVLLLGSLVRFTPSGQLEHIATHASVATHQMYLYTFFQDVNVMIFIGFGFLMVFLKYHNWSSVGLNFMIAAFSIQTYILFFGLWYALIEDEWDTYIEVDVLKLITADYCAGAILITFGGILGKVSPLQLLVVGIIESCIYALNEVLAFEKLHLFDVGGSIVIHTFGAFFGLAVSWGASPAHTKDNAFNTSNYASTSLAFIGTLFLWMFWPSFNSAIAPSFVEQQAAVFNTIISLTGSALATFALSPMFNEGRIKTEDVLNATLAGGVIVGASCNVIEYPVVALIFGVFAGVVSTVGFEVINPYLTEKLQLFDTCGILYLHGLPGVLGGLFSSIVIAGLESSAYILDEDVIGIEESYGIQAVYQLAALGMTLAFALIFGLLTGMLIKSKCFGQSDELFLDIPYWIEAREPSVERPSNMEMVGKPTPNE